MAVKAKAIARVFDYASTTAAGDGGLNLTIEWKLLVGNHEGGKMPFSTTGFSSSEQLRSDVLDALSAYLSTRFSPTVFKPRDIVGAYL